MSYFYFTNIQTQIRDLEALRDACGELSLAFTANAKCSGYAGITRLAPHVIQLKGPYDIAVEPAKDNDGSHGLTTDWWDGLPRQRLRSRDQGHRRSPRQTPGANPQTRLLAVNQPPEQPTTTRRRRMNSTLCFDPGGHIGCLYTEAIDLRALGRLTVVRVTDIRFNPTNQQWDVHAADTGQVLF